MRTDLRYISLIPSPFFQIPRPIIFHVHSDLNVSCNINSSVAYWICADPASQDAVLAMARTVGVGCLAMFCIEDVNVSATSRPGEAYRGD